MRPVYPLRIVHGNNQPTHSLRHTHPYLSYTLYRSGQNKMVQIGFYLKKNGGKVQIRGRRHRPYHTIPKLFIEQLLDRPGDFPEALNSRGNRTNCGVQSHPDQRLGGTYCRSQASWTGCACWKGVVAMMVLPLSPPRVQAAPRSWARHAPPLALLRRTFRRQSMRAKAPAG